MKGENAVRSEKMVQRMRNTTNKKGLSFKGKSKTMRSENVLTGFTGFTGCSTVQCALKIFFTVD